jgi:hypothetical protein
MKPMAKGDVPKNMRSPHNIRSVYGSKSWYYIGPSGLRIFGVVNSSLITRKQLERALEIIKQEAHR